MKPWNVNEPGAGRSREPRLRSLARRLRDWLDEYLQEASDASLDALASSNSEAQDAKSAETGAPIRGETAGVSAWEGIAHPGPPEHWLKLVRDGAPGLLLDADAKRGDAQHDATSSDVRSQEPQPEIHSNSLTPTPSEARLTPSVSGSREVPAKQDSERHGEVASNKARFQRSRRPAAPKVLPQPQHKEKEEEMSLQPKDPKKNEKEWTQARLGRHPESGTESAVEKQAAAALRWVDIVKQKLRKVLHASGKERVVSRLTAVSNTVTETNTNPKKQEAPGRQHARTSPGFRAPQVPNASVPSSPIPNFSQNPVGDRSAAISQGPASLRQRVQPATSQDRFAAGPTSIVSEFEPAVNQAVRFERPERQGTHETESVASPVNPDVWSAVKDDQEISSSRSWTAESWSADAMPGDPWPELPESQPFAAEHWMPSIRNAERLRALDAEQRGGR